MLHQRTPSIVLHQRHRCRTCKQSGRLAIWAAILPAPYLPTAAAVVTAAAAPCLRDLKRQVLLHRHQTQVMLSLTRWTPQQPPRQPPRPPRCWPLQPLHSGESQHGRLSTSRADLNQCPVRNVHAAPPRSNLNPPRGRKTGHLPPQPRDPNDQEPPVLDGRVHGELVKCDNKMRSSLQIGVEACSFWYFKWKVKGHFLGHRDLDNLGHREKSYGIQIFWVSPTVSVFKPQVQY